MIRERIIRLHYDEDALDFITSDAVQAFERVLGRMLSFGLKAKNNDGLEVVELYLDGTGTITGAFYPPTNWQPSGSEEDHAPFITLSEALEEFKTDEPLTMAASQNPDGTYAIH